MRFGNARQCIHDAFATNMTSPDGVGGTKFNSLNAVGHQYEAGKIISAVFNQPRHLRGTCMFINAPDRFATERDIAAMKVKVWESFIRKNDVPARAQCEVGAIFDQILLNYRRRCHNHTVVDQCRAIDMATMLGREQESFDKEIAPYQQRIINILARYDFESLQPVWEVITKQREERDKMEPGKPINPRTGKPYKDFKQAGEVAA